ncbi:MAG: hypothetical protein U1B80_07340, partial [Anaerolineaceae bacterium]|nr:hypothetical protein [Anaerolineaceae bacterium]
KTHSFWMTVLTVELMDLVFSLDNVIAAVSLSNKLWVVMLGVAIGIVAMRFAAGIFSYLVEREPILKHAAYILVLSIGIQLVLDDLWKIHVSDWARFAISVSVILGVLAYARFKVLQVFRPVLVWLSHGFAHINEIVNWALVPVVELLKLIWKGSRLLLHTHHGSR